MKSTNYIVATIIILLISCSMFGKKKSKETTNYQPKEYPLGNDYEDLWKKVEKHENDGLPKSALKVVEEIYGLATKEKNVNQIVKATMYRIKYSHALKEESYVSAVYEMDSLISTTEAPQKQILHSILAEMYWSYYTRNRWKFRDRTKTVNFQKQDIRTWSLDDIVRETSNQYKLSLTDANQLQEYSLLSFKELLQNGENTDSLRPTLYDFLGHRALAYFRNTEPDVTKPAYYFQLEDEKWFLPAQKFTKLKISHKNSNSTKLEALKIYKELTKLHLYKTINLDALADLELDRVQFIKQNNSITSSDKLYVDFLENLSVKTNSTPYFSQVRFVLAQYYSGLSSKYRRGLKNDAQNARYQASKKNAVKIAEEAIKSYPNSYGAINCRNLINTIKSKRLDFVNEEAVIPSQLSKSKLSYTNIDKVYLKVIKLDFDDFKNKRFKSTEERARYFNSKEVVHTWEINLPDDGFYNPHDVEFVIPETPVGYYALVAATDKSFSYQKNAIAISPFWSTNLSCLKRSGQNGTEISVFNRKTGIPMESVKAEFFSRNWDYNKRKYITKKVATKFTDKEGYIKLKSVPKSRSLFVNLTKDNDRFNDGQTMYQYQSYRNRRIAYSKGILFTDRSIYRPNQKVYFKGLVFSQNGNVAQVLSGKKVIVTFFDVNYQKIDSKELTTNEFGTVSGEFKTPQGLLNGRMTVTMTLDKKQIGSKSFYVEEYKRPKFEVNFEPIKGEYKLDEQVNVVGVAKAFSGNNIDGANVSFRVSRTARFPWWCWYYYGYRPNSAEVEISNGETKTDENGKFEVDFTAIADKTINQKYKPTYTYEITADVTDLNGETRSNTTYVSVGVNSLIVSINVPQELNRNSSSAFKVTTTNLNGQNVDAKGRINVYKLKKSNRLELNNKWENPDVFLMTEAEHNAKFPFEDYGNKSEYEKQEEGKEEVYSIGFDTKKSNSVEFNRLKRWQAGNYQVEVITEDKFGNEVKELKLFTIYDDKSNKIPMNKFFWSKAEKISGEPGETAVILIGSGAKNVKMMYEVEHKGKIIEKRWFTLNNELKRIEFPIEEKHRGNVSIHVAFIKENHVFMKNYTITVPFTNKQLDVTFETFRNKLLPGQKEKWKVNIIGAKGDKVLSEMLASMYDASLDEFASNYYGLSIYQNYYAQRSYNYNNGFGLNNAFLIQNNWYPEYIQLPNKIYYTLNNFGMYNYRSFRDGLYYSRRKSYAPVMDMATDAMEESEEMDDKAAGNHKLRKKEIAKTPGKSANSTVAQVNEGGIREEKNKSADLFQVKARKNFNETAFFFPHLTTNSKGDISFEFEMPEALTKWKFMGFAHTKDMRIGTIQKEIITQKDLMVVPNMPRFLREGDKITLSSKISNISDKTLNGKAQLFLFDALTDEPIDVVLSNENAKKSFAAKSNQSTSLSWGIEIPFGIQAVKYKIVAQAGNFTDGEENALPVLTNRMLVTESMPLPVKKAGTHTFNFDKLKNSGSSKTLKHHKVSLEYTSNPAWYVVQAMPYMMEYPYDCAEQTFTRFYANSLATHIMNGNPKIKEIVSSWQNESPEAFLSNLEKNQELKAVILEQTPWVLDAKNEHENKKRIAQLFDLNKMSGQLSRAMNKLQKMQKPSGGWPWFDGMKESRYITQHVATGMGHLDFLGVKNVRDDSKTWNMVKGAIRFLDREIKEDLERVKRYDKDYKENQHINNLQVQYLYARSFLKDIQIPRETQEAYEYYLAQSKEYWLKFNNYQQGMIALANFRIDKNAEVTKKVMASLKERSIIHPELGMYWKGMMDGGYYWYQAPIETQAIMIELFDVAGNDQETVNELKTWLLKQKQTTNWKTTKATTEACYALLLNGTDILANDDLADIKVGDINIAYSGSETSSTRVVKAEKGTGYFKTSWSGEEVTPSMGTVKVTKKQDGVSWGALYWQYFEDLDKITPHDTPLKIKKKLFIEKNTEKGKVLDPISENNVLNVGDKIIVRIEIEVDRNMEYIHMKDMRASGLEPINVISRYKWQDGLGYYESTKDASTDFFMDYLPRGTYVFEYPLRASQRGNFSNGITSIQCMYAPEFGSHSEGIRVEVK